MAPHANIDAHIHLWDPARNDDILVLRHEPSLRYDANAAGLAEMMAACSSSHAIAVQSAPDANHVAWLLDVASRIENVIGVVAWLDPSTANAISTVRAFAENPHVCGIRLMLNRMDKPLDLLSPQVFSVIAELAERRIAIECLAPASLIPLVAKLAEQVPQASFILDHGGLPGREALESQTWRRDIATVAAHLNVSTKLSGIMEPFGASWTVKDAAARLELLLEAFGPHRLMRASNWPVVDLGGGARRWFETLEEVLTAAALTGSERQAIDFGSALRAYPRAEIVLGDLDPAHMVRSAQTEKFKAR